MDGAEKDSIDRLNDKLYSRARYSDPLDKRTPVKTSEPLEVQDKWQTPALDEMLKHERIPTPVNPLIKKVFIASLVFFIVAIGVAIYVFMGGATFVSSKNVDISVLGPATISAGEVLELGVSISNTNNADLEFANLSIQYPQGSRNSNNTNEPLTYTKDNLGVVGAGKEAIRNVQIVLLGSSKETKEIKFSVEYKVKGSNATFYKDKIFEITIGDAPITLTVDSPASVTSGSNFTTKVAVTLNSKEILKNVILKAEYPYGYTVTDASPKSASDNNIWALGDLSPGDKKTITIKGQLLGENKEERTFRFYVGVSETDSVNPNLKIPLVSLLNTVAIDRPALGLNIAFNGESGTTYVAPAGQTIATSIRFQNNLPDRLLNPHLEVRLSGAALDKFSVSAKENGFYDSGNSKVIWDLSNSSGNRELAPGEGGQVDLNFASLASLALVGGNRDINLDFSLAGVPVGSVGQMPISVTESRVVKISSQVSFSARALRSLGPFTNTGPIPPKAEKATTYTIALSAGNTQNDLTNAKVVARLGPGVSWVGNPSTSSSDLSYDASANIVTWNLGTLSSGSGFSSASREMNFQISLTPSISQIGTVPTLVHSIVFSGTDTLTGEITTINNSPLTTRLVNEPLFIQGDDIVVK